jgi:hypothetical protein
MTGRPLTLVVWLLCAGLWGLASSELARAQVATIAGTEWTSLSHTQRQMLEPLAHDWPVLGTSAQQKWIQLANRMPAMSLQERERISQRMKEWARLPPAERARARAKFQQAQGLTPPGQRKSQWEAYQALPQETRAALSQRASSAAAAPPPIKLRPSVLAPSRTIGQSATARETRPDNSQTRGAVPVPVSPALKKVQIGATTTLASKAPTPPPFQRSGLPKIAGSPDFVDERTLLPKQDAPAVARTQSRPTISPTLHAAPSSATSVSAP